MKNLIYLILIVLFLLALGSCGREDYIKRTVMCKRSGLYYTVKLHKMQKVGDVLSIKLDTDGVGLDAVGQQQVIVIR